MEPADLERPSIGSVFKIDLKYENQPGGNLLVLLVSRQLVVGCFNRLASWLFFFRHRRINASGNIGVENPGKLACPYFLFVVPNRAKN
jgi:hypothetical protein